VIANSRLAEWYKCGDYAPMALEDSVTQAKKIYLKFKKAGIDVIRMGLQASEDLVDRTAVLAAPYHPAFGHLVHSEIFLGMAISVIESANDVKETFTIFVNPRSISKMRGLHNSNIEKLEKRYHFN
jgi:histone acetyltransferase (RNA polymerase elongator complex component)